MLLGYYGSVHMVITSGTTTRARWSLDSDEICTQGKTFVNMCQQFDEMHKYTLKCQHPTNLNYLTASALKLPMITGFTTMYRLIIIIETNIHDQVRNYMENFSIDCSGMPASFQGEPEDQNN